jgi:starvation-inducible DNA-binding protein
MPKNAATVNLEPSKIDLSEESRRQVIELLDKSLADTFDLYSQVKQAHWNVRGTDFYQLHLLFDQLAGEIEPFIDQLAERVTALGGIAHGTARMAAKNSSLTEYPEQAGDGHDHIQALIDRYAIYTAQVRKGIRESDDHEDPTSADLYTEISRTADKHLWFLEAHFRR